MGASKRSFMEQREYESLIKEVTTKSFKSQHILNVKAQRIVTLIPLKLTGTDRDFRDFRNMLQIGWPPYKAAKSTLNPIQAQPDNSHVKEPKNRFADYWEDWRNSPDYYDEERENRL